MPRIAIVATAGALDLDTDGAYLFPALARAGLEASVVSWRDPEVSWGDFELAVVRATWDYVENYQRFCQWLSEVERVTTLLNPAGVIAWNTDKLYLSEVADAGLPIVPTSFLYPSDPRSHASSASRGRDPGSSSRACRRAVSRRSATTPRSGTRPSSTSIGSWRRAAP